MTEGANRAIIDLSALRANFARARELARGREVIAVVKADAYGHGAVAVAHCLAAARRAGPRTWKLMRLLIGGGGASGS